MTEYVDKKLVIELIKERYKRSDAVVADINKLSVVKSSNNEIQENYSEWINRKTKEPEENGQYWCRYTIDGNEDNPFYQALQYHITDTKRFFQHENHAQFPIRVTHWMPIHEPI